MRPLVVALAVASASAPVFVLALAAVPFFLGTKPPLAAFCVVLAAWAGVFVVRAVFARRLSSTELAIVRFWSLTPPLVVPIGSALGALPLVLLYALGVRLGPGVLRMVVALLLGLSTLLLWQLWRRFQASLSSSPRRVNGRADPLQMSG